MNEKCIISDSGPFQRDHRGNATRHVPGGGITSAIRDAQSVASGRERPASVACYERLPPGPRRRAARHAPPAPAPHAGSTAPLHAEPPGRDHLPPLQPHAPHEYWCFLPGIRAEHGTRGGSTHRETRGAGPARCVTHLSRRILACSRNSPSAETRFEESARRPPMPHC